MANYEICFRHSVSKDLRRLPRREVARILEAITALANDPRPPGVEKLSASEKYRIRCGRYRVLYEIRDDSLIVTVVKVAHRRHVYRCL